MKAVLFALALSANLSVSAAPSSADEWLEETAEYKAYDREVELSIKASGALVGYLLGCGQDDPLSVMMITSHEDYVDRMALTGPPRAQLLATTWFDRSVLLGMPRECDKDLYKAHLENVINRITRMREAGERALAKGISGPNSLFD